MARYWRELPTYPYQHFPFLIGQTPHDLLNLLNMGRIYPLNELDALWRKDNLKVAPVFFPPDPLNQPVFLQIIDNRCDVARGLHNMLR